jgi:hypothetical protein
MTDRFRVPRNILSRLQSVCLGLPEAYEEQAWVNEGHAVRGGLFRAHTQ